MSKEVFDSLPPSSDAAEALANAGKKPPLKKTSAVPAVRADANIKEDELHEGPVPGSKVVLEDGTVIHHN